MNIREIIEDLEVRRKLFHLCALLLWLIPLSLFPTWLTFLVFFVVLVANVLTLFQVWKERLWLYYRLVFWLEREKNLSKPGVQALWANLGVFLVFLLFGRETAVVSVVVLAVGDAFASIVGMKYGRIRIGSKSLEGTFAFFLSSFLVLLPLVGLWKALVVAFVCALVEALPMWIDDNLSVPLVAGLVYYISV